MHVCVRIELDDVEIRGRRIMEGVCRVRFHVLWIQFRLNAPINTNQKLLTSAVTYVGQIYGLDIMHLSLFQNEFMV